MADRFLNEHKSRCFSDRNSLCVQHAACWKMSFVVVLLNYIKSVTSGTHQNQHQDLKASGLDDCWYQLELKMLSKRLQRNTKYEWWCLHSGKRDQMKASSWWSITTLHAVTHVKVLQAAATARIDIAPSTLQVHCRIDGSFACCYLNISTISTMPKHHFIHHHTFLLHLFKHAPTRAHTRLSVTHKTVRASTLAISLDPHHVAGAATKTVIKDSRFLLSPHSFSQRRGIKHNVFGGVVLGSNQMLICCCSFLLCRCLQNGLKTQRLERKQKWPQTQLKLVQIFVILKFISYLTCAVGLFHQTRTI